MIATSSAYLCTFCLCNFPQSLHQARNAQETFIYGESTASSVQYLETGGGDKCSTFPSRWDRDHEYCTFFRFCTTRSAV